MIQGYARALAAVGHFVPTANHELQNRSWPPKIRVVLWLAILALPFASGACSAQAAGLEWHVFFQPTGQTFVGTDPVGVATAYANAADAWVCPPNNTSALCPVNPQVTCPNTGSPTDAQTVDACQSTSTYAPGNYYWECFSGWLNCNNLGHATQPQPISLSAIGSQYFVKAPALPPPSIADEGVSCHRPAVPACRNGPDPVNPSSGNEILAEADVSVEAGAQPLTFGRYYNSLASNSLALGPGWSHSFSRRLTFSYAIPTFVGGAAESSLYGAQADACTSGWAQIASQAPGLQSATAAYSNGTCTLSVNGAAVTTIPVLEENDAGTTNGELAAVEAYRDDGHVLNFTASGSGFTAEPGVGYRLVSTASRGYQVIDDQDNVEAYDGTGKLLSIADRAGNTQTLTYDSSTGLLSSASDNFGHTLTFAYDSQNRLASLTAPDGSAVRYAYDSAGHLSQVTNLDGSTRQYNYSDPNWPTGLSSVIDENGQTEFSLTYNSQGQVVSSTLGGESSSMSFSYNSDGSTTETDPLGAVRTFQSQEIGDHELSSSITGSPCFKCGYVAASAYDSGGFPASETDFNGNVTVYIYDDTRGLETSRTEEIGRAHV